MARQAEAEREKRAGIINAEHESLAAARGVAADMTMAHSSTLPYRSVWTRTPQLPSRLRSPQTHDVSDQLAH